MSVRMWSICAAFAIKQSINEFIIGNVVFFDSRNSLITPLLLKIDSRDPCSRLHILIRTSFSLYDSFFILKKGFDYYFINSLSLSSKVAVSAFIFLIILFCELYLKSVYEISTRLIPYLGNISLLRSSYIFLCSPL